MAEVITEMIIPGVYVAVNAEGLIRAGAVSVGNVGMVGTAEKIAGGPADYEPVILSSASEAKEKFGSVGTLPPGIELAFNHGARTIYAVKIESGSIDAFEDGLNALLNQDVHIVVTPGADAGIIMSKVMAHCEMAENEQRDRIGIVGSALGEQIATIKGYVPDEDRLICVAPGIKVDDKVLSGSYSACAIAGLLASLPAHHSPTNKSVMVSGLEHDYSYSELKQLVNARVLVLEKKSGYRIVKGITTNSGAWKQITTRRIVDYAKAGIRQGCLPYIGKLNNERVRGALKATVDGFLAAMKQDEMLIDYSLEVKATRDDEIEGRCIVTTTLKPTFSIDYIKVIIYLE